jgi:hypothetical protein
MASTRKRSPAHHGPTLNSLAAYYRPRPGRSASGAVSILRVQFEFGVKLHALAAGPHDGAATPGDQASFYLGQQSRQQAHSAVGVDSQLTLKRALIATPDREAIRKTLESEP